MIGVISRPNRRDIPVPLHQQKLKNILPSRRATKIANTNNEIAKQLPNIVFMTSHDTGDWLGSYGHDTVHSPNLDRLAAAGCRFANSFCTSPVCTPSRGAMMTGRYPQTNGLMGLIQTPYRWRYNEGERHISHLLADSGYQTVLFNHQHEAAADDPLGFQEKRIFDCGPNKLLTGERVSTAAQTAEAFADFVRERPADQPPFYAQIGFFETHTPYNWNGAGPYDERGVELPPYVKDNPQSRSHIAGLQGSILSLDQAIGNILDALSSTGLAEDTIVVFTVDHGIELERCKWQLYDGGIRTALLLRWPGGGIKDGQVCDWLVSNVDLVPSLLDLSGLPIPQNLDGKSFAGFFQSDPGESPREAAFAMMHSNDRWVESRCIHTEQYKLIRNFSSSRLPGGRERPVLELYDLRNDPFELENVAGQAKYSGIQQELDARLWDWLKSVDDPILRGPVPTPYYLMAIEDMP